MDTKLSLPTKGSLLGGLLSGSVPTHFNLNNRPRSIYQYSSMAPRLSGQNSKFFKFLLSLNSLKRLKAAKYEIQKLSTCRATLFRCKVWSMFPVFHLARST